MRQRLSTLGVGFLVLVLLAVALGSCERSAEERAIQPTVPLDGPAATAEPLPGGEEAPLPGETVVSAVTPATGTMVPQPTQELAGTEGTPAVAEPAATAAPEPTQPVAVQPTAAPATQGQSVVHTVQAGETLSSIARRYGTTWQAIAQANGIVNPNQIYVGQQLRIGTSTSSGGTSSGATGCRVRHTVKQGEWVWQIARTYGASPYDILAANGLSVQTANTIHPGTVLCIP
jgi:LysM repeat protein